MCAMSPSQIELVLRRMAAFGLPKVDLALIRHVLAWMF